jgi:FAD dependent monooxygenase
LLFTGRNGIIYWFIFSSLENTTPYNEAKRYDNGDIKAAFARVAHVRITPAVTFAEVFRNRRTAVMTPLEEGIALRWTAGRMALMGDAAHKMVPHAAMGANQAMESAACFASRLLELREQLGGCSRTPDLPPLVSPQLVEACLEGYVQKRKARIEHVVKGASLSCRIQLKIGDAAQKHIARLPSLRDEMWLEEVLKTLYKAEKIEPWDAESERVRYYSEQAQMRCGSVKRALDSCC